MKLLLTIRMTECTQNLQQSVKTVYRRQKLFSIMVWAVVSNSWKSPQILLQQVVNINLDLYINNIQIPAFEELKKHFKHQHFTFQQYGTLCHTSIKTQQWCKRHFPRFWSKEMWPTELPDLNRMDFSVWSMLKAKVASDAHLIC